MPFSFAFNIDLSYLYKKKALQWDTNQPHFQAFGPNFYVDKRGYDTEGLLDKLGNLQQSVSDYYETASNGTCIKLSLNTVAYKEIT